MITYDSGADNHYISEADKIGLGLPILPPLHKRVAVTNGGTSSGKYVTHLPFPQFFTAASEAEKWRSYLHDILWWQRLHFQSQNSAGLKRGRCSDHVQRQASYRWQTWWARSLSHPVNADMGTMATSETKQEIKEFFPGGKQCLWLACNRRSNQMDTHSVWLSSQIQVDQGHQVQRLHRVTNAQWTQRYQVLSGDNRDTKRAFQPNQ